MKFKTTDLTKPEARYLCGFANEIDSIYYGDNSESWTDKLERIQDVLYEINQVIQLNYNCNELKPKAKFRELYYFLKGWFEGSEMFRIALQD